MFESADKEREAQRGEATSPRWHSRHVGDWDSDKPCQQPGLPSIHTHLCGPRATGQDDEADLALTRAAGRWRESGRKGTLGTLVLSLPQLTGHQGPVVTSAVGRTPFPAWEVA